MMKCKWAGDPNDEYCKNCDGVTMEVDDNSISCAECAGYEAGAEEVETETKEEKVVEEQKEPEEETSKDDFKEDMNEPEPDTTTERTETAQKQIKKSNPTNNTSNDKKAKESENKKVEKKAVEKTTKVENGQVKVVSMRYTSGATIKKGDNYFKFVAEEEWDVSQVNNVDDVREQLWAKLNGEVDKQIEELQNL